MLSCRLPFLVHPMHHAVMLAAEPSNVERFRVIVVVPFDFLRAADFARRFDQRAIRDGGMNSSTRRQSFWMSFR